MRTIRLLGLVALAVVALVAVATACGSPAPPAAAAPGGPSREAAMVCSEEAREDIAVMIGVPAVRIEPPTWSDSVYSCRHTYTDGAFVLSVKDLPDAATTTAYFEGLGSSLGRTQDVDMPGANAFVTTDGSVVVQKDQAVLTVDVSGLPAQFGRPPVTPPNAALLVATAILSCWTGV